MAEFEVKDGVCVIPKGTTEISGWDFTGCSNLYEVVIPATVINISSFAFDDCTALEKIVVEEGNPKYDSREACNAIIETATNKLICGCKSTVIPASVKLRGYFPKGLFRRNSKGRFLKTDRKKAKRNYHNYTVKSYEEAKELAYDIWSYHDTCCYIMDEVIEKKNVLKIKFYLPCIMCDDEGNYSDEEFYIYEIFKIKLRYNKGIKREPLLNLGD